MNEIFIRRSVRKFENKPIELDKIDSVLKAAMQAPSAYNHQPWEFIVVTDTEQKIKISETSQHAKCAKDAAVDIIFLANLDRCVKDKNYFPQDMSACIENMLLQSVSEGLGGTWLAIYPEADRMENLRKIYNLPANIIPFAVVALGYPLHETSYIDRYDAERISVNGYKKNG